MDVRVSDVSGPHVEAEFTSLYERHHEQVRRFAVKLAGSGPADDLVAEVFASLWNQMLKGSGPSQSVTAYLIASVRHQYADDVRKAITRERILAHHFGERVAWDDAAISSAQWVAAVACLINSTSTDSVEANVLRELDVQRLRDVLAALPERYRLVLWLREFEELSGAEVAAQFNMGPNAVRQLASRARAALRSTYLETG